MAKQLYEIKYFNKGIDTSMSASDIDADTANYSINVDARARLGHLKKQKKSKSIGKQLKCTDMIMIKTKDLGSVIVGFNPLDAVDTFGNKIGGISIVTDIYGDKT